MAAKMAAKPIFSVYKCNTFAGPSFWRTVFLLFILSEYTFLIWICMMASWHHWAFWEILDDCKNGRQNNIHMNFINIRSYLLFWVPIINNIMIFSALKKNFVSSLMLISSNISKWRPRWLPNWKFSVYKFYGVFLLDPV